MNNRNKLDRRQFIGASLAVSGAMLFPAIARAANVRELSGVVYINKQIARQDSVIRAGDVVSTSHNGRISFTLGADAFLLKERSSLRVEADQHGFINLLRLFTGRFLGAFSKADKRRIVTSTATIGIRGTACFLDVGHERNVFLHLLW